MGSEFQVKMADVETAKEATNNLAAKKFSPFSVDSLLATKVKLQQQQQENNNDNDHHHYQPPSAPSTTEGLDLSLKREEASDDDGEEDDEDEDIDCDKSDEEVPQISVSPGLPAGAMLHQRFAFPMPMPPVPTSTGWNPVNPWMGPQFRSPLNPFMPSK